MALRGHCLCPTRFVLDLYPKDPSLKFTELGLAEPIVRAVVAEGYIDPTPIQEQAIPHVLAGSDLLGCAQTGTGKTAAFALPILHRLMNKQPDQASKGRRIRLLVLSPTRELASQITESFAVYGRHTGLRQTVIYGGVGQYSQTKALRAGIDILVATPGRLLDLMNQGYVDLRNIEVFVLDEADRMFDMGFIQDIRKVVAKLPTQRQTLLFSATMPPDIRQLANTILRNPVNVQVAPVSAAADTVTQAVYHVERKNKPTLLRHILKTEAYTRALIFTRTKHGADRVVKYLTRAGIYAAAIHGDKTQAVRERALSNFKSLKTPVLVATDIAARGIDIDQITHVVNYDVPEVAETYVHRIGRTGRAGATGIALSFCDAEERADLKAIERLIRKPIDIKTDEPDYAALARETVPVAAETAGDDQSRPPRPQRPRQGKGRKRFAQGQKPGSSGQKQGASSKTGFPAAAGQGSGYNTRNRNRRRTRSGGGSRKPSAKA